LPRAQKSKKTGLLPCLSLSLVRQHLREVNRLGCLFQDFLKPVLPLTALEPMFVFPGKGSVGLEDDYLVTETGVERLTLTDQTVIRL